MRDGTTSTLGAAGTLLLRTGAKRDAHQADRGDGIEPALSAWEQACMRLQPAGSCSCLADRQARNCPLDTLGDSASGHATGTPVPSNCGCSCSRLTFTAGPAGSVESWRPALSGESRARCG